MTFVGIERVRARIGRYHDRAGFISRAQIGLIFKIKVGEPVVDQINGQIRAKQLAIAPLQTGRIDDHGLIACALEQARKQAELRIQVLFLRIFIDDGDCA